MSDSSRKGFYLPVLILFTAILSCLNLFYGFGEDPDSMRIIEAASQTVENGRLIPSRSWGFPLYESLVYSALNFFSPGFLPAQLISVLCIIGSVYLLFHLLIRLQLPAVAAFWLCIAFVSNPLIIIASNTILETGMNVFFLMLILYYFVSSLQNRKLGYREYFLYAVLFGLANLVRPDNMLYFPALFILLLIRRQINIVGWGLSAITFIAIGILPYYLVHYPIFKSLPSGSSDHILTSIKNIVAMFGLPLIFLMGLAGIYILLKHRTVFRNLFKDDASLYVAILGAFTLARTVGMPDELEYGILLWILFIVATGILINTIELPRRVVQRFLIAIALATFIPNLVQVYFFREVDFEYKFSPGITNGVIRQERWRRIARKELLTSYSGMLMHASDSLRRKDINYKLYFSYLECDTCIVLTTKKYVKSSKIKGTDEDHTRIILTTPVNISRGWRNFVKDDEVPALKENELEVY